MKVGLRGYHRKFWFKMFRYFFDKSGKSVAFLERGYAQCSVGAQNAQIWSLDTWGGGGGVFGMKGTVPNYPTPFLRRAFLVRCT